MNITERLKSKFPKQILSNHNDFGDETVVVSADAIIEIMTFLRDDPEIAFDLLLDVCGVDYPDRPNRFEVVYHLYSLSKHHRLRVKASVPEKNPVIKSVIHIWEAADWFEREAYDMFGIIFDGHPKLKRLLMWEAFEGHPLRKDYPMGKRQPVPEPEDII